HGGPLPPRSPGPRHEAYRDDGLGPRDDRRAERTAAHPPGAQRGCDARDDARRHSPGRLVLSAGTIGPSRFSHLTARARACERASRGGAPMSRVAERRQQWTVARHRSAALALVLLLAGAPVARADIDLTGTWDLRTSLVPDFSVAMTIVQTGTTLSGTIGGSASGTIDPVGGVFFLSRSSSACDGFTLTGLAAQDGNTMTGSGSIEVQLFPGPCAFREIEFAARRGGRSFACGNGNLDAGESCDDGNLFFGDCCTPVCTFNVLGWPCASDGQACTLDQCDGAGTCTHPLQP